MNSGSRFFHYPEADTPQGTVVDTPAAAGDLLFLGDRSDDEWTRLIAVCERRPFRAGDTVIRAGEHDRALYIVARGELEVRAPARQRRGGLELSRIESGSVLGEVAFFDGMPRSATVRATSDGELLRLSHDAFEALALRDATLARAILFDLGRILAQRLRRTNAALAG